MYINFWKVESYTKVMSIKKKNSNLVIIQIRCTNSENQGKYHVLFTFGIISQESFSTAIPVT